MSSNSWAETSTERFPVFPDQFHGCGTCLWTRWEGQSGHGDTPPSVGRIHERQDGSTETGKAVTGVIPPESGNRPVH
jgi:hypothetical protein